jgi:sigma-B regulation protein RsbU (phosphoserine phosphatase)
VYSKEKLMGVVGIGMLLDELNAATVASHAYDNVNEVIVNQDGDVICSTVLEGDFAFNADDPVNLLSGSNAGLSSMLRSVLNSNQQEKLDVVEVDGEKQYVTCVRIEKADWFYISAVPEASVYGPTQKLEGMLRTYFDEMLSDTDSYMWNALLMSFLITIVLFVLAGLMVRKVSYWLITPINRLSEMVKTLDGDNLQFEWEQTTGDEIDLRESYEYEVSRDLEKVMSSTTTEEDDDVPTDDELTLLDESEEDPGEEPDDDMLEMAVDEMTSFADADREADEDLFLADALSLEEMILAEGEDLSD